MQDGRVLVAKIAEEDPAANRENINFNANELFRFTMHLRVIVLDHPNCTIISLGREDTVRMGLTFNSGCNSHGDNRHVVMLLGTVGPSIGRLDKSIVDVFDGRIAMGL